ncbi:MAG TPA: PfkB family carbohydrate kinase [Vicinamibacterales bacterium]|nr:PfkB family carbohydrate kinase [Vicinamibacterales bacterium]
MKLEALIKAFKRVKIAVAGDLVADEFIYGQIDRVSREAPVLILKYDATEIVPGGAGNAANNASALGARVNVIGIAGRDSVGDRLVQVLGKRANVSGIARIKGLVTPVKTRILAGGVHSAKQQVVRIDRAGDATPTPAIRAVETALVKALRSSDAIILSDYGAGLITPASWKRALSAARVRRMPVVVLDSRYNLTGFTDVTACTPNESEAEALVGFRIGESGSLLERAGRTLLKQLQCKAVLITRGSRGMALFEPDRPTNHIPIVGSDQIADVTGAGDTVIATFALALAAGGSFVDAARLANFAGGLVVMKRGTATVDADELIGAVRRGD